MDLVEQVAFTAERENKEPARGKKKTVKNSEGQIAQHLTPAFSMLTIEEGRQLPVWDIE